MNLRDVVQKYQALAGDFGRPVALAAFGLPPGETKLLFSMLDEDYLISRFLHFSLDQAAAGSPGQAYEINGFLQSHVSLDAEVKTIL
jgi:hypothetical protein